eukprot:TRINITY_DN5977_c0_g1_i2.p1 TRINITY_DN5977_c0_g1~~TRINITY_DN5977_c0_g1_i2.p1  ORF type:complete len:109 (+),score=19.00 TRINITY_DN5977_c0_g1_i2:244-570(+)
MLIMFWRLGPYSIEKMNEFQGSGAAAMEAIGQKLAFCQTHVVEYCLLWQEELHLELLRFSGVLPSAMLIMFCHLGPCTIENLNELHFRRNRNPIGAGRLVVLIFVLGA